MNGMNPEDLENYEADQELTLYREYRDVVQLFRYIVETERRFYLANEVSVVTHSESGDVYFAVELDDAWVWDIFRTSRFIKKARILTFKDVNVEELPAAEELTLPDDGSIPGL